jgi:very-short-patch-repair endonuclease
MSAGTWEFLSSPHLMPGPDGVRLDSPIERAFYRCFLYVLASVPEEMHVTIDSQVTIGEHRVDFVLSSKSGKRLLIVECDGHDFHERTKEQAARDKRRDRELLAAERVPVMRYTGSEIYRGPFECACDALSFALNADGQKAA